MPEMLNVYIKMHAEMEGQAIGSFGHKWKQSSDVSSRQDASRVSFSRHQAGHTGEDPDVDGDSKILQADWVFLSDLSVLMISDIIHHDHAWACHNDALMRWFDIPLYHPDQTLETRMKTLMKQRSSRTQALQAIASYAELADPTYIGSIFKSLVAKWLKARWGAGLWLCPHGLKYIKRCWNSSNATIGSKPSLQDFVIPWSIGLTFRVVGFTGYHWRSWWKRRPGLGALWSELVLIHRNQIWKPETLFHIFRKHALQ